MYKLSLKRISNLHIKNWWCMFYGTLGVLWDNCKNTFPCFEIRIFDATLNVDGTHTSNQYFDTTKCCHTRTMTTKIQNLKPCKWQTDSSMVSAKYQNSFHKCTQLVYSLLSKHQHSDHILSFKNEDSSSIGGHKKDTYKNLLNYLKIKKLLSSDSVSLAQLSFSLAFSTLVQVFALL